MKVKSVQKIAITYFYVETDDELFPTYRRSEQTGQWEHLMSGSWEPYDDDDQGSLEQAFRYYIQDLPLPPGGGVQYRTPLFESDVFHIEHIDADHIRLTKIEKWGS